MRSHPLARNLWWTATAALAAALFVRLYPYVLPVAALRMEVFRRDAAEIAAQFLRQEKIRLPPGYRQATTFYTDDERKAYLEQTLGLPKANRVLQSEGLIYRWVTRWFRPGEYVEYYVEVDPAGGVLYWCKDLPDDAAAPPSKRPRQVAAAFVQRISGIDVSRYELKDTSDEPLARRHDYGFTWERPGFRLGEATQRVRAIVTGDRVIYYDRYLHVPESFYHRFDKEQEKGDLLTGIAAGLSVVFYIVAIVTLIIGVRRRTLWWRGALPLAIIVSAVGLLSDLNSLPLRYAQFDVTASDFTFWLKDLLSIAVRLAGSFLGTIWTVAVAEWLYRRAFLAHTALPQWFTPAGLASAGGRRRLLLGYWLVAVQLAYVSAFYFLAERYLRGWSPAQVRYDDLFSTAVPWAYALLIGVQPAVSEEFLFRVLAISWLKRLVKRNWLAILLPAIIWGFLHCSYPNKPFYIRGVEVTLWGLVFGWVFVRFGVLPSLLAHAGYNAVVTGTTFLASVTWPPRLSFGVVLVLVLLPFAAAWWWARRRGPVPEAEGVPNAEFEAQIAEAASRQPPPLPFPEAEPAWRPIRRRVWVWAAGLLVVGIAVFALAYETREKQARYRWPEEDPSPFHARHLSRADAVRIAATAIRREKVHVQGWVMSAVAENAETDADTLAYLSQFLSQKDADELARRVEDPSFLWTVRWQRPLARENWEVRLDADGRVLDVSRGQPEEAPGPSLSAKAARALAENALRGQGIALSGYRLTGKSQHEYPERTAHYFTWEPRGLKVGEAQFLTDVEVDSKRVNGVGRHISVPDSYLFGRSKETAHRAIAIALSTIAGFLLFGWGIAVYALTLRRYEVRWLWALGPAALVVIALLITLALDFPALWSELPETLHPIAFISGALFAMVVSLALLFGLLVAIIPVGASLWRAGFPDLPSPRFWWQALWRPLRHSRIWREAVLAQFVVCGIVAALGGAYEALSVLLPPARQAAPAALAAVAIPDWLARFPAPPGPEAHPSLAGYSPALFSVSLAIVAGAACLLGWLMMAAFAKAMFRRPRVAIVCCLALSGMAITIAARDWREATLGAASAALGAIGLWLFYWFVGRTNPLSIFATAGSGTMAGLGATLLWFPAHRLGAIVLVALPALLFLWAVVTARANRLTSPPSEVPPAAQFQVPASSAATPV